MFSKTIFIAAFAAVASIASAASPPACLLGAVNTYSDPTDISAVCKSKDINGKVSKYCGDATADAMEALAEICNKAGVKVSTDIPTSTGGSSKPSGTGYTNGTTSGVAQPTGTGAVTGTGVQTGGGPVSTGTPTQSGVAESTGAAGKLELSFVGMVAGLGFMAAAL